WSVMQGNHLLVVLCTCICEVRCSLTVMPRIGREKANIQRKRNGYKWCPQPLEMARDVLFRADAHHGKGFL
ncbi:hypothetical protein V3C99_006320, partial [Haemonchus contortus]